MLSLTKKNLVALIGITSATLMGTVAGCSGDDSVGVNPGDDSGTAGNDGSSGGDGSSGKDGSTSDGGSDSGGPTSIKAGNVTFTQTTVAALYSNAASASFYVLPAGTDLDCAGFSTATAPAAAEAACTIKVCTNPILPDAGTTVDAGADAGPFVAPNTGDITLKSALQTAGVVLAANTNGTYTPITSTTQWWNANDATGEVKSNGSTTSIAAFDDTGLVTPGDVTNPTLAGTNVGGPVVSAVSFDRGTALAITYSGGIATTKLTVRLTTTSTAKRAIIACDFDASNGTQSIASADLENLEQAGSTGVTGAYSVQARTIKPTTVSDFTFDVILATNLHSGSFTNSN